MFNWLRSNAYRQHVLDTVCLLMVDADGALRRSLLQEYPGIEKAIKSGQDNKRNKDELAITIVQAVFAATIEQMQDHDRLQCIANSLYSWANDGRIGAFKQDVANGHFTEIDGFDLRLRAALSFIWDMQNDQRVEDDMCHRFLKEIIGALDGLDAAERERRRYVDVVENIKETLKAGEDDDSDLMPVDYEREVQEGFSGVEYKVQIVSTPSGLVMQREDNGRAVTDRRTLTQDLLGQVPPDAESLIFVNLTLQSGEIYSCIIVEPGGEVFGDQRAAWWSLARTIVRVTEAKANGLRMTAMAHAHLSTVARAVWDSATRETPIDHMRDQLMQMRHIHFQVINQGMKSAENEAQKLGREIALAMVMAVQSEDEKLERFAFKQFRKFIWVTGEEPKEFWHHECN
jgi:hypothetical protein